MKRWVIVLCGILIFPGLLISASARKQAWSALLNGAADSNPVRRTQALTALGTIGADRTALEAIEKGLHDHDPYVRVTAVAVLGELKSPRSVQDLRRALHDDAPPVRFVAARSLWLLGDQSGRAILLSVLSGEKQENSAGFIESTGQSAKEKLYDRSALARMGVGVGSRVLLGPFGMGVGFAEDLLKDKNAPQRVVAAELLARDHSPKSFVELEQALDDKNGAVRAAAARALGRRGDPRVLPKLEAMRNDKSEAAKFMAAASIVRLTEPRVHAAAAASPHAQKH